MTVSGVGGGGELRRTTEHLGEVMRGAWPAMSTGDEEEEGGGGGSGEHKKRSESNQEIASFKVQRLSTDAHCCHPRTKTGLSITL